MVIEAELYHCQQQRSWLATRQGETASTGDRINALREAWQNTDDKDVRYSLRSEAHAAIREILTEIT